MNKELYSVVTTSSENHYYYDVIQQILAPLHPTLKYILDNYLKHGEIDTEKCKKDVFLSTIEAKEIDYYLAKIEFWKNNGFFSMQSIGEIDVVKLNEIAIKDSFASADHISFEITERCNLKCTYCIYGDYYNHYSHRDCSDMNFETAKTLLDYKLELWFSHNNNSAKITKLISFYGGEPLLNFKLIEQIVDYTKNLSMSKDINFRYNITTNGILLHKYLDFLIENNFLIAISLDGNEQHNQYRIFQNGLPSFKNVMNNIERMISKNKSFFENNVLFNSVLHHKSSITEITNFFKDKFHKTPMIGSINQLSSNTELSMLINNNQAKNKKKFSLSKDKSDMFTYSIYLSHYNLFFNPVQLTKNQIINGACVPFSKCIFMTAKGLILPCERISHDYAMGEISGNQIRLDYQHAAGIYNEICQKYKEQCVRCYKAKNCRKCLFTLSEKKCPQFMSHKKFADNISVEIFNYEKSI